MRWLLESARLKKIVNQNFPSLSDDRTKHICERLHRWLSRTNAERIKSIAAQRVLIIITVPVDFINDPDGPRILCIPEDEKQYLTKLALKTQKRIEGLNAIAKKMVGRPP